MSAINDPLGQANSPARLCEILTYEWTDRQHMRK